MHGGGGAACKATLSYHGSMSIKNIANGGATRAPTVDFADFM